MESLGRSCIVIILNLLFCGSLLANKVVNTEHYFLSNPPIVGTTIKGQNVRAGGYSGLSFVGIDDVSGNMVFLVHTDRGPTPSPVDLDNDGILERPFALPHLKMSLTKLSLNRESKQLKVIGQQYLKTKNGIPLTGLCNISSKEFNESNVASTDEIPADIEGNLLPFDPFGVDLEGVGIARGSNSYWMVDEYRPSIIEFDFDGTMKRRLVPKGSNPPGIYTGEEKLPAVYAKRRLNRGFEAIAVDNNKVYAFMQSSFVTSAIDEHFIRILEFDSDLNKITGEYFYQLAGGGVDKIADAVSLGNRTFLVLERDSIMSPDAKKLIYKISLDEADNIYTFDLSVKDQIEPPNVISSSLLRSLRIKTVQKLLLVNAVEVGYIFGAQLEGLTLVNSKTIAIINDNGFGLGESFDPQTGLYDNTTTSIEETVLSLIYFQEPLF